MRGMSNGGAWLCRSCHGPDGEPWRNWADKTNCHKCKVAKGRCFLAKAGAVRGSCPTTSARQRDAAAAGGKSNVEKELAQVRSEVAKLRANAGKPGEANGGQHNKLEQENKRLREELIAAKSGKPGEAGKASEVKDEDGEMEELRDHIRRLTGIPGAEEALAAKKATLADKLVAKRLAKPIGIQVKDLEAAIDRRKKGLEKTKAVVAELLVEQLALAARIVQAEDEQAKSEADIERMEGERAMLYKARMDEASAAAKVDWESLPQSAALAGGREALAKLQATGGADPGVIQALEKALAEALKAAAEKSGGMEVDAGTPEASAPNAPVSEIPKDMLDVDAMAALAEFLAADDGKEGAGQQDRENKFLQVLRNSRKERSGPY